jgi:hypothetical protein
MLDVQKRFTDILKIYFAYWIVQWFRDTVMLIACLLKPELARKIFVGIFLGCGCLQCCYGIACLVILHVYRYTSSGKICSLDFMTYAQQKEIEDLWSRWRADLPIDWVYSF